MDPNTSGKFPVANLQERYRLLAKLGSGGMADVFLGVQLGAESFQRLVVIKRIHARWLGKIEAIKMFIDEARTVASLSHPHVVKIFDLSKLGNDICITMEYVDGENLEYVMRATKRAKGRIPLPILCKLMLEACEALHYAHSAKTPDGKDLDLVHRDIGPHNLMIDRNGYLKVIDFGIAKSSARTDLTSPGLIKGKFSYMAPDVFKSSAIDGRVDLYALGLVFYELLTLRRSYHFKKDVTVAEVFQRVLNDKLPKPSSIVPGLPKQIDDIIAKATHKDRDQRYPNCESMAVDLRSFAKEHGGLAANSEVEAWFKEKFQQRIEKRQVFERRAMEKAKTIAAKVEEEQSQGMAQSSGEVPLSHVTNLSGIAPGLSNTSMAGAAKPKRSFNPYFLVLVIFLLIAGTIVLVQQLFWANGDVPLTAPPEITKPIATLPAVTKKPEPLASAEVPIPPQKDPPAAAEKPDPVIEKTPVAVAKADPAPAPTPKPKASQKRSKSSRKKSSRSSRTTRHKSAPEPARQVDPADEEREIKVAMIEKPPATVPPPPRNQDKLIKPVEKPIAVASAPKVKLLSGSGNWNGSQVLTQGCRRCHNGSKAPKLTFDLRTKRQWQRFFSRHRHKRNADLRLLFSQGELKRVLEHLLKQLGQSKKKGITGVK